MFKSRLLSALILSCSMGLISTAMANSSDPAAAGTTFLASNKSNPGVMTTASGLEYKVLEGGSGSKPGPHDVVSVDYEGRLLSGQVFDSSYQRGNPANFAVDAVIPGWTEALQLMPVGSTWEIYIPSNLAYGASGVPGTIGPNELLIFKVHLISVQPEHDVSNGG